MLVSFFFGGGRVLKVRFGAASFPGSLFFPPNAIEEGKKRDPGNEVGFGGTVLTARSVCFPHDREFNMLINERARGKSSRLTPPHTPWWKVSHSIAHVRFLSITLDYLCLVSWKVSKITQTWNDMRNIQLFALCIQKDFSP